MAMQILSAISCWWIAGNCTIIPAHLPCCLMKGSTNESPCLPLERPRPAKSPAGVDARFREGAQAGRANRHALCCPQICRGNGEEQVNQKVPESNGTNLSMLQ